MKKKTASAYSNLLLQKEVLKIQKLAKEEELKTQFKELFDKANPVNIVKEYLQEVLADKDLQLNASKVGLNLGTNFLIEKILGRSKSIKGYLSSMLVEKFSTSIINMLVTKHQNKINKKN